MAAVLREVEVGLLGSASRRPRRRFPDDPKAQMIAYFGGPGRRARRGADYRGCALSNAVVEYPDR